MIRIAICDDEQVYREQMLKEIPEEFLVEEFSSGMEFIKENEHKKYDIVFLDIDMPKIQGTSIAEILQKKPWNQIVIFVTNHDGYASGAYRLNIFRYVLKKNLKEEFKEALLAALKRISEKDVLCVVNCQDKVYRFACRNALYVEKWERGVKIRMWDPRGDMELKLTLRDLIPQLESYGFIQTHKSHLVNMRYVAEEGKDTLLLDSGHKVYLSRGYKKEFHKKYIEYLRGL